MSVNVEELRGLLASATARPWKIPPNSRGMIGDDDRVIGDCYCSSEPRTFHEDLANATLIAAAVNALPLLLDELESLRAVVEEIRDDRDKLREGLEEIRDTPAGYPHAQRMAAHVIESRYPKAMTPSPQR